MPALFASAPVQHHCKVFDPMTFGILPFISAEQLVTRFTPLVDYLTKNLKTQVRIETAPDFQDFARRTRDDQRYDILFTAPHFFYQASQVGYQIIARVDSPGMRAVIVAHKNSGIKNIADLKGKRLASLSPNSLASLLVMKYLSEHGVRPKQDVTIVSTPTHNASLLSSYYGVTDASALMQPPYEAASQKIRDSMHIIAQTQSAPHMPISVSAKINKACATEISNLLFKMSQTEEGLAVLKNNRFTGFIKANSKDYENINSLLSK